MTHFEGNRPTITTCSHSPGIKITLYFKSQKESSFLSFLSAPIHPVTYRGYTRGVLPCITKGGTAVSPSPNMPEMCNIFYS